MNKDPNQLFTSYSSFKATDHRAGVQGRGPGGIKGVQSLQNLTSYAAQQ